MTTIQEITDIRQAIPKRGVWYKYFDDIFVSVLPTEKIIPHVRRKAVIEDNKTDHKICPWHLDWQYTEIEANYGCGKLGKRTYEIQITVDDEKHIIDSLVENIAIEFQHTLSVSLEEMNSRYVAHKKAGYIPYLVIDLTSFSYNTFLTSLTEQELFTEPIKLKRLLSKWHKTEYNRNNNLFLDLKDAVLRLSDFFTTKHLRYEKSDFVKSLFNLELKYKEEESEQVKRNEQARKEQIIAEQKSRERLIEWERQELELDREKNSKLKSESENYKYFRACISDKTLKPFIEKYENDRFDYFSDSELKENIYSKTHQYISKDNDFEIQYTTISKVEMKMVRTYRRGEIEKPDYKYLFAEIRIVEGKPRERKVFNFKKQYDKITLIPEDNLAF